MRTSLLTTGILCFLTLAPVTADGQAPQRTISVSGEGKAAAPPDMANIQTGVVTTASTAQDALAANNQAMKKLMQVVRGKNIEDKDVQTSGFNVHPEYERGPRGREKNEIIGYRVTNQVSVRVRNLSRLGEILDALVRAGSNQLSGIGFGIDDPRSILNQARTNAMDDARGRAELYARAASARVGKLISISEQSSQLPRPDRARTMMMAESSSVPVATGEQEVSATVNVVYELVVD